MAVWPGDPPVRLESVCSIPVDGCNVTALHASLHAGTHYDAPRHYLANGTGVEVLGPEVFLGPALVVECLGATSITRSFVQDLPLTEKMRILFKTDNSSRQFSEFEADYTYLDPDAAQWLADQKPLLVGIDGFSVGGPNEPAGTDTHLALLSAGIWLLENLLLQVSPGSYELCAPPLLIPGTEAAPARAMLRPLENRSLHDR